MGQKIRCAGIPYQRKNGKRTKRKMAGQKTKEKHIFSDRDIWKLLIPLIIEQLLAALMGTVDTMMVSNVGSAAISAVSLVDSINILVIQAFTALAAGGTILCSQYMGSGSRERAGRAAAQLLLAVAALSTASAVLCLLFRYPLLRGIFGSVDAEVMRNSEVYFFYTSLSFPFLALYSGGAAVFQAQKNTKTPMTISVISNFLNIGGNAFLIWGLHMGVAGAAISTLVSRMFCAIVVLWKLRSPKRELFVRDYHKIRPDWSCIRRILAIGIPSGIENSMFQFGKLAIQSTVSMLGTAAIAAQAMTNILESMNGIAAMGVGIGMMTIVGQCMGAGRKDEAVYYIKKITVIGEIVLVVNVLAVFAATKPVIILGGMEPQSAKMCFEMMCAITIVKPLVWNFSFIPAYGMRGAGDVKFSMIVTCISMWLCRVTLSIFLCRFCGTGPMGVWIAMFTDWTVRAVIFSIRFRSRKWLNHRVM